ncbi:MAG: YggT family protein [Campylobacterales bacterium]|nr:YggT family protein [Campylobacterales bacterium]
MIGDIILGLGNIVHSLINLYMWVVIIAALLSWVRPDPYNPIVQLLHRLTAPVYALVRRHIPSVYNGIDLSPLIIIIALQVIDVLFVSLINNLAQTL